MIKQAKKKEKNSSIKYTSESPKSTTTNTCTLPPKTHWVTGDSLILQKQYIIQMKPNLPDHKSETPKYINGVKLQSSMSVSYLLWMLQGWKRLSEYAVNSARNKSARVRTIFPTVLTSLVSHRRNTGSWRVKQRKYKHYHSVQRSWTCWVTGDPVGLRGFTLNITATCSVSLGRICQDNCSCWSNLLLLQSQYSDTGPTSPNVDPMMTGVWQGSHWSAFL